jgi:hypothetical protein
MRRAKLTAHRARNLPPPESGQHFTFCSEVKGFGVRCTPGDRSYIVQPRFKGRKPRITLGRVDMLPFEGPADAPGARDLLADHYFRAILCVTQLASDRWRL